MAQAFWIYIVVLCFHPLHGAHDADGKHQVGKDGGGIGSIGKHEEAWKQDGHERGAIGRQRFV